MTISGGRNTLFWTGGSVLLLLAAIVLPRLLITSDAADGASYSQRDSSGVEVVESYLPRWQEGEGWRVGGRAGTRIGAMDGEAAYQFSRIAGVAFLPDGGVVVGDGGSQEIRFFDAQGRHLRTVGRRGEGPGEFYGLSVVGVGPSGDVWAYDFSLRRITWFNADGEMSGLTSMGMEPPTLNAVGPLPDETFLLKQLWGSGQVSQARTEGLRRDPVAWVRFDSNGSFVDSLGAFPGREVFITQEDGRGVMNTPPFARGSVGTIRGDRVVVGDQEEYELRELSFSGDLLRVIRIPERTQVVTPQDVEEYILGRLSDAPPERHPSIRQSLGQMPRPETEPAYGDMLSDELGNLWVQEWTSFPESPPSWSVFDQEGMWLGEVEMPERFEPGAIGRDWILGVERDELDVEYVVLYPLERR